MGARTVLGAVIAAYGLWVFLRSGRKTAAQQGSGGKPSAKQPASTTLKILNAHDSFEARGVLDKVTKWPESDQTRFTDAISALGVAPKGELTKRPPLFAREDALALADQFDAEGKDRSVGAAIRDFVLASDSLPQ